MLYSFSDSNWTRSGEDSTMVKCKCQMVCCRLWYCHTHVDTHSSLPCPQVLVKGQWGSKHPCYDQKIWEEG